MGSSGKHIGFGYQYNLASQRTQISREDGSHWKYGYDSLGQVISGQRYWSDRTRVIGQQFGYDYDDIGNRIKSYSGGDADGSNMRVTVIGRKGVSPRKYTKQLYSPYEFGLFSTLMARKVRIEYAGAYYHVINRGNYRSWIFESVGARKSFLNCLFEASVAQGWRLHAWVLMSNH